MKQFIACIGMLLGLMSFAWGAIYEKQCLIFEESYTFDEDRYSGKWYEIRRLHDASVAEQEDCVQEKYIHLSNQNDFDIERSVQIGRNGEPIYSVGEASPRVFQNSKVPQFYLRYNTTNSSDPDISMDIVQTDYLNYAIVYSCNSVNTTMVAESAWVLSRRPAVSKHAADLINKFISTHFNHPVHTWRVTEQSESFCKPTKITSGAVDFMMKVTLWQSLLCLFIGSLFSRLVI